VEQDKTACGEDALCGIADAGVLLLIGVGVGFFL